MEEQWRRVGRVQRTLEEYVHCAGEGFGEASDGVHGLINIRASSRMKGLQGGRECFKGKMGVLAENLECGGCSAADKPCSYQ